MEVEVQIVNAFIYNQAGGNPAGVVLNADHLTSEEKLKVAAKTGLSETAFVSQSSIADFKLEFFTPNRQIAHCGHATIATFSYLAQLGKVPHKNSSKETIDGRREILLQENFAFMEQRAPRYTPVDEWNKKIIRSLGITSDHLLADHPIHIVNTGNSFLIIPLRDQQSLKNLVPDMKAIQEISEALDLIGFYPFTRETANASHDANSRMFAPRYAIPEESGTGMAAGPLAGYLFDVIGLKKERYAIEQGWFMEPPSPSQIIVDLHVEDNQIKKIMAGGMGILKGKKIVEI